MSGILYKATRPDGTDFRTGTISYAAACGTGQPVTWAGTGLMRKNNPATYLSLSSEPGEVLTGGKWPCRLFEAEPVGETMSHSKMGFKVCCRQLLIVREVPAHLALGPNGEEVAALIARAGCLTGQEICDLAAAWDAAWDAAGDAAAAWNAALAAAWDAGRAGAWNAAWAAARAGAGAAEALVVRDLITAGQFALLRGPWASVIA